MRRAWCTLYLIAALGCSDAARSGNNPRESGVSGSDIGGKGGETSSAGRTGRSAGTGGRLSQVAQVGDPCTPADNDAGVSECAGGVIDFSLACHPRYEAVRCYVADLVNGEPNCLEASDAHVINLISDDVVVSGFVPQSVIRANQNSLLPASCEAQISCCAAIPDNSSVPWKRDCYDQVERFSCELTPQLRSLYGCQDQTESDAGAEDASRHGLCCYLACGYLHES